MGKKKRRKNVSRWNNTLQRWEDENGNPETLIHTPNTAAVKTAEKKATDFKLIVPRAVMDKISWWMHKTNQEVSGFGSLSFDEKTNTFTVKDAILLKQKVSSASAEIDPNAMGKAMFRMKDDPNGLKWHWHSHVNMGVFWSADDMEIIRSLGQRGWILATVFNYKQEKKTAYLSQVTLPNPAGGEALTHDVFVNDIETNIINYIDPAVFEPWDKEYKEHVTDSYVPAVTTYRGSANKNNEYTALNWNTWGYAHYDGLPDNLIYNPVFDSSLKSQAEKIDEIKIIPPNQIEILLDRSPSFALLYKAYLLDTLDDKDAPTKAEEAELDERVPFGMNDFAGID